MDATTHGPAAGYSPVIVSLPVSDRRASYEFYHHALGLAPVGDPAEDGLPEPLQFALNDQMYLMLVPTGGFGWVIGGNTVAPPDHSECVLGVGAADPAGVGALVDRAARAGARVVAPPADQPWGYSGTFADPDGHVWMVTSVPGAA